MNSDLLGFALLIGYYLVVIAIVPLIARVHLKAPFEVVRKMHHIGYTMSIFLLLKLFSTWYVAILAAALLVLIAYPALAIAERFPFYRRAAVERERGEWRRQLVAAQTSLSILIFVFWGLLGEGWQYVAVVAAMAWGFGDAAAALVGKAFGRHHVRHRLVEGAKTIEGTLSMLVVTYLAVFFTLLIYARQSWYVSLAVAAVVAPVCSVVELFSRRGMDTLTVPLSAALPTLALMSFFSFLGL